MKESIETGSIDLIFADPPYNLSGESLEWKEKKFTKVNEVWDTMPEAEYLVFTKDWLTECTRVLKPSGSIYVCASKHNLGIVLTELAKQGLSLNNIITWFKSNAMPSKQCRTYTHACEYIAYAVKGTGWTYNYDDLKKINTDRQQSGDLKAMRDMWIMPKCAGKERIIDPQTGKAAHSTQKPLRLVNNCVIASSLPGEIVLDPFMGSGTTAESCMRLNRKFVGIDLEEKYVKISNDRIIKTASELAASLHSGTSSSRRSLAS